MNLSLMHALNEDQLAEFIEQNEAPSIGAVREAKHDETGTIVSEVYDNGAQGWSPHCSPEPRKD